MPRTQPAGDTLTPDAPDRELVRLATAGSTGAFEELYRRHSQAAWRVAQAVTHNTHDAADAVSEAFTKVFQSLPKGRLAEGGTQFRPYLMAATRNAAIDGLRRQGKATPSDAGILLDIAETRSGPTDRLVEKMDASLVATAFASLPERWRTILWLTEVEGMAPRDAAEVMDLTANGAAQLAVRARTGLRERYLQVHLAGGVAAACAATVPLLGAYAAGGLSSRDLAKVDQHLAGCEDCTERAAELEDLNRSLRRIVLPFPLALAGLASGGALAAKLGLAGATGSAAAGAAGGTVGGTASTAGGVARSGLSRAGDSTQALTMLQRPLLVASVAMVAVGIMAIGTVDRDAAVQSSLGARPSPFNTTPSPASVDGAITDTQAFTVALATAVGRRDGGGAQLTSTVQPAPASAGQPASSGGGPGSKPPAPPAPKPKPIVNADVRLGSGTSTAGVAAGAGAGSCTGVQISTTTVGCPPAEQKKGSSLTVSTRGDLLGERSVSAP